MRTRSHVKKCYYVIDGRAWKHPPWRGWKGIPKSSPLEMPFEKASLNRRHRLILIAHHHSECFQVTITNLEEHVKWIPCAYIRCRIIKGEEMWLCSSPPQAESHDVKIVTVKGSFLRSVTRSSTAKTQSKLSFCTSESSPTFPDDRGGSKTGKKSYQVHDRSSGRCESTK